MCCNVGTFTIGTKLWTLMSWTRTRQSFSLKSFIIQFIMLICVCLKAYNLTTACNIHPEINHSSCPLTCCLVCLQYTTRGPTLTLCNSKASHAGGVIFLWAHLMVTMKEWPTGMGEKATVQVRGVFWNRGLTDLTGAVTFVTAG